MTLPKYRLMVFFISLLALVVPLLGRAPLSLVMILSQAFNVLILPLTVICIFILTNRADLMGTHKNTLPKNIALVAIFLFSLVIAFMAIDGLIGRFRAAIADEVAAGVTALTPPIKKALTLGK